MRRYAGGTGRAAQGTNTEAEGLNVCAGSMLMELMNRQAIWCIPRKMASQIRRIPPRSPQERRSKRRYQGS
jgi:hypothetical protein